MSILSYIPRRKVSFILLHVYMHREPLSLCPDVWHSWYESLYIASVEHRVSPVTTYDGKYLDASSVGRSNRCCKFSDIFWTK